MIDIGFQGLKLLECGKEWWLKKFLAAEMRGKTIAEVLHVELGIP